MIKVAIIGATGYTGGEIIRILLGHPQVEVTYLSAKINAQAPVGKFLPNLRGKLDLEVKEFREEDAVKLADCFFLSLPHRVSMEFVPSLLRQGKKVVDLSADYRLRDTEVYSRYYGKEHTSRELLQEAVYGLPEFYREKIKKARLVANPGCYPTCAILGIAPLLKEGKTVPGSIIVDAKTGISGAGRWPGPAFTFSEADGNVCAYKVGTHQHQPEIEQELGGIAGKRVKITFVPHVVPASRGMLLTIYANLKDKEEPGKLREMYERFYQGERFIRIMGEGELPQTKHLTGSNDCHIAVTVDPGVPRVVVLAAIDNLVKGAAGQAVQNLNLMCGLDEGAGLRSLALLP